MSAGLSAIDPYTPRVNTIAIIIVKDGQPVSALWPFDGHESLCETLDILETEPDILKRLTTWKRAQPEIAAGRLGVRRGEGRKGKTISSSVGAGQKNVSLSLPSQRPVG